MQKSKSKICVTFLCMTMLLLPLLSEKIFLQTLSANNIVSNPIIINTAADLYKIIQPENSGRNFVLDSDIDLSKDTSWHEFVQDYYNGWKPLNAIGQAGSMLDGRGFSILGLKIYRDTLSETGLFSQSSLAIQNLNIIDADIDGGDTSGILAGISHGSLYNISVGGVVKGQNIVGGLVGISHANIGRSSFSGEIEGAIIGGLVGNIRRGTVRNCLAEAIINGRTMGGFVGIVDSSHNAVSRVENSIAYSRLTENTEIEGLLRFGGFAGILNVSGELTALSYNYSLAHYAPVAQGGDGSGTSALTEFEFLLESQFESLDFSNIWYFTETSIFPQLRHILITIVSNSQSISINQIIDKQYFYLGEEISLNLLANGRDVMGITVNEVDNFENIFDGILLFEIDGFTEINIEYKFLLEVISSTAGSGNIIINRSFFKVGDEILIEVVSDEGFYFKSLQARLRNDEINLIKISDTQFKHIVNGTISEGDNLVLFAVFNESEISLGIKGWVITLIVVSSVLVFAGIAVAVVLVVKKRSLYAEVKCND